MSSTILYKFRSGTTFEALSLPGNNARLLDIKKAIVTAKKLDQGSMDFDLSVKDATSGIEYTDDTAILPRGTRIVVQRLPSARGQGILAKIARSQFGDRASTENVANTSEVNADFYTIENRDHDDDEEFVSSSSAPPPPPPPPQASLPSGEDSELAALRAATDATLSSSSGKGIGRGAGGTILRGGPMAGTAGGGFRSNQVAGMGAPPPTRGLDAFQAMKTTQNQRPNADPELREQEQQPLKKRATGIPRTFLSLSAPQGPDGSDGGGAPVIQPNTFVFEELISRGGGQSENAAGSKRDLDYAIKLTATKIPDYLLCAICHNVVRDAMMLPWDPEGRTTCEQCIRTALTENGFRCPLTQQEGVSPDDLLPNYALRKAATQFINDVMEKLKEIDLQAEMEEEINIESDKQNLLEGDLNDKGVVLTRRVTAAEKRKKENVDFGEGDDDFGGDVFAVEPEKPDEEHTSDEPANTEAMVDDVDENNKVNETIAADGANNPIEDATDSTAMIVDEAKSDDGKSIADSPLKEDNTPTAEQASSVSNDTTTVYNRRITNRRRGPPIGYSMGPAIAAVETSTPPTEDASTIPITNSHVERAPYRGGGGGRRGGGSPYINNNYGNSGRGYRGRYDPNRGAGRYDPNRGGRNFDPHSSYHSRSHVNTDSPGNDIETRVAKRIRSSSDVGDHDNDDYSMSNDNSNTVEEQQDVDDHQYKKHHWDTTTHQDASHPGRGMTSRGNFHRNHNTSNNDARTVGGRWNSRGSGRGDEGFDASSRSGRWDGGGQREGGGGGGRFPRGGGNYRGGGYNRGGRGERDGYQQYQRGGGNQNGGSRGAFGGGRGNYRGSGGGRGRY